MADLENQVDNSTPENVDNTPEVKAPSEIEVKAREMGWRPLEEFNGSEEDFIDAKEFVRRKPLFDKIEHSSREVKELRKAFDALKQHYTTVKETEYNRALASLKAARKEALSTGDGDRFEVIDDEIKRVEKEAQQVQEVGNVAPEPTVHPEFAAWTNRNPWYSTEGYMRTFADDVGKKLAGRMSPLEVLKEVEKAVKAEFPHKFRNPNKQSAPDVDSSTPSGSRKETFELNDMERNIMNTLVRSGAITKEKYLADLKLAKGIK